MADAKYTYWYFQKQLDKEICENIINIKNKIKNYGEKGNKETNSTVERKSDIC